MYYRILTPRFLFTYSLKIRLILWVLNIMRNCVGYLNELTKISNVQYLFSFVVLVLLQGISMLTNFEETYIKGTISKTNRTVYTFMFCLKTHCRKGEFKISADLLILNNFYNGLMRLFFLNGILWSHIFYICDLLSHIWWKKIKKLHFLLYSAKLLLCSCSVYTSV